MNIKKMFYDKPVFFTMMAISFILAVICPLLIERIAFVVVSVCYYKCFFGE
jgi:hypothetical protein